MTSEIAVCLNQVLVTVDLGATKSFNLFVPKASFLSQFFSIPFLLTIYVPGFILNVFSADEVL